MSGPQVIPADEAFDAPEWWGAGIGTTAVGVEFQADHLRASPWHVIELFVTGDAGPEFEEDEAVGLGYLSGAQQPLIGAEFVTARTQALPSTKAHGWYRMDGDALAYDDLDLRWTFRLVVQGTQSSSFVSGTPISQPSTPSRNLSPPSMHGGSTPSSASQKKTFQGSIGNGLELTGWLGWVVGWRCGSDIVSDLSTDHDDYDLVQLAYANGYYLWVRPSGTTPTNAIKPDADLIVTLFSTSYGASYELRTLAVHTIPNGVQHLRMDQPVRIRVVTTNTAGNPTVIALLSPWYASGSTTPSEVTLFSVPSAGGSVSVPGAGVTNAAGVITDANATYKLTQQGALFFGGYSSRVLFGDGGSSINVREGLVEYEVYRTSTSELLVREHFERVGDLFAVVGASVELIQNIFGEYGPGLESTWTGGLTAPASYALADLDATLVRTADLSTSHEPLEHALLGWERWESPTAAVLADIDRDYAALRPSSYATKHRRSVQFKGGTQNSAVSGYAAQTFRFGIALRGSLETAAIATCAAAWLEVTTDGGDGSQDTCVMHVGYRTHDEPDGAAVYLSIASVSIDVGTLDVFDGNWHKLDFEMVPVADEPVPGGPAFMRVWVDDAPQTLALTGNKPGVVKASATTVLDPAPTYAQGSVEGLFVYTLNEQTNGSAEAWFDPWPVRLWTEQAFSTEVPESIPPDLQGGIAVGNEGMGDAAGDLASVLPVDFEVHVTYHRPVYRHAFDSGHVQTAPAWSDRRRRFRLSKAGATEAEALALLDFYDEHVAGEVAFTWTTDDDGAIVCRFLDDSLRIVEEGPDGYSVEVEAEELLT